MKALRLFRAVRLVRTDLVLGCGQRITACCRARIIRQGDQAYVNAPSKPVVFALEDERGTKRKISLPPVSFGSQSLVDNRVPVSYTGNSRIW